ncbi:hypothetical protein K502DRAFT_325950 [Neoconidiobolus thromboides FSU 785]|nr:hypothetical protein K502DRAFT_325950 [Neoconidiobolus thromboides FSU 785]
MRLYRYQEERKMKHKKLELGDVTTVNLDMMKSGTAINVVPDMVEAWYDVRANPKVNLKELQAKFETFAKEANVTYEQISKDEPHSTVLEGNPFWENLKKKGEEL